MGAVGCNISTLTHHVPAASRFRQVEGNVFAEVLGFALVSLSRLLELLKLTVETIRNLKFH